MISTANIRRNRKPGPAWVLVALLAFTLSAPGLSADEQSSMPEASHDGLVLSKSSRSGFVYLKPEVDFGEYTTIMILPCQVAFVKGWQKDYNRAQGSSVSNPKVTDRDMAEIKTSMADLFAEVFIKEFSENGGYEIVTEPRSDTLLMRPAIIDLSVYAPVLDPAVRSRVTSAGEGTLYLELYDAVSGEILARIVDRRRDPDRNFAQWATRAFNRAAAEGIMRDWARELRERFDEAHEGRLERRKGAEKRE